MNSRDDSLVDPDAPASEEELAAAEDLRLALEDPSRVSDEADLARALSLAHAPREIPQSVHDALVSKSLDKMAAKRTGRSNVIRVAFGASTALAIAAAVFLFVRFNTPAPAPVATQSIPLVQVHSTAPLFHAPFDAATASARIDRIAMARSDDLREKHVRDVGREMKKLTFPLLLVMVAAAIVACSRSDAIVTHSPADAGTPVDLDVMAFLSEARALHHEANLREASNDDKDAIISLEKLTTTARPHPDKTIPEVEEVLADTYARTAEIRLRDGDIDGAAKDVKEGTAHAQADSYFRGHVLEVGGIIEEARAASLSDAGKTADADAAKKRALAFLHEAVEIQDKVIRASLTQDGGAP